MVSKARSSLHVLLDGAIQRVHVLCVCVSVCMCMGVSLGVC